MDYDFREVEARWQKRWEEEGLFRAPRKPSGKKFYALEMFAYPSGDIHMGHFRNYTLGDAIARVKLMQGCSLLHPFGWDAFGLPAENAAIKHGLHPADWTRKNIGVSRATLQRAGVGYDWSREVTTCLPEYYRWNQWLFLLLYERGLAYRANGLVNWCPSCATVLANEQVKEGACERCDTPVERRRLTQWYFRTTAYGDRLLEDLGGLSGWPESIRAMQTYWIGRSEGAEIEFDIAGTDDSFRVFTTRPDTLGGVTFMALAPESELVERLVAGRPEEAAVRAYVRQALARSEQERGGAEVKEGVFTGVHVVHPLTEELVPIWVADYVLGGYGTGAIMGVPAHDERDFAFARANALPVTPVIFPADMQLDGETMEAAYTGPGVMRNSGRFDGMSSEDGARAVIAFVEGAGKGEARVNYRLRDWLISRQRYWGTPIPMVHCGACGVVPVPEEDLPVLLPEDIENFQPKGRSPLADSATFMQVTCPRCGGEAARDPDTMDTFVDSSWYYLRYLDPHREESAFDPEAAEAWLPVDLYIGGATHATGHLLYFRFIHKVLHDAGYLTSSEPAARLYNHGMVFDAQGLLMSKSRGNVVSPVVLMGEHGVDALRLAMLFAAPPEREIDWTGDGLAGTVRFLRRVYRLLDENAGVARQAAAGPPGVGEMDEAEGVLYRKLNRMLARVARDLDGFGQNTAVAALMEFLNELTSWQETASPVFGHALREYVRALAPLAPHLAEELWQRIGGTGSVFRSGWLRWDEAALEEEVVPVVVQVNGKLRAQLSMARGADRAAVEAAARADERVARALGEGEVRRVVHVPDKLVNFVITQR